MLATCKIKWDENYKKTENKNTKKKAKLIKQLIAHGRLFRRLKWAEELVNMEINNL